ncbi:MAG: carbohydrate ABC transporter substrate-binding protein [Clostridiales bacterium]|nr:carbohydrate ABC transporter substrate-binding protein [Clostridiales bacterium]
MKKCVRNLLTLAISMAVVISSVACKKGGKINDDGKTAAREIVRSAPASGQIIQESDPFYDLEEFELDLPSEDDRVLYNRWIDEVKVFSDCVLAFFDDEYGIDKETQEKWKQHVLGKEKLSKEEAERIEKIIYDKQVETLAWFDLDGTLKNTLRCGSIIGFQYFFEGKNGEKLLLYNQDGVAKISELTPSMDLINTVVLPEEIEYVKMCLVLPNGNFLVTKGWETMVFDPQGNPVASASGQDGKGLFHVDGKFYQLVPSYKEVWSAYELVEYDTDTCKMLSDRYALPVSSEEGETLIYGPDAVYLNTGNGLCALNKDTKEMVEVIPWNQTDCYHGEIYSDSLRVVSNEEYYYAIRSFNEEDQVAEAEATQEIYRATIQHLKKAQKNPHAGKRYLSAMGVGNDNAVLYDAIVDYNRDMTKKSRIYMTEYSPSWMMSMAVSTGAGSAQIENQVYMDLLNGQGPDILINFGSEMRFERDNVLLDMNTLIDGPNGLDRSTIFDNILEASERNGKLYRIPLMYTVTGFVGNAKYTRGKTNIDWSDIDTISTSLSLNTQLLDRTYRGTLLQALLENDMERFVNYDEQKVDFNNDEFRKILEFCRKYALSWEQYIPSDDNVIDSSAVAGMLRGDDSIAFFWSTVSDGTGYSYNKDRFAETDFCGFPTSSKGGMSVRPIFTVSIAKQSKYHEEAWDFVKSLLSEKAQTAMPDASLTFTGLPINRVAFDKVNEKDIKWEEFGRSVGAVGTSTFDYEDMEGYTRYVESIHNGLRIDSEIESIILEEAEPYFVGQKSLDDVIGIIEKRVKLVVQEWA